VIKIIFTLLLHRTRSRAVARVGRT